MLKVCHTVADTTNVARSLPNCQRHVTTTSVMRQALQVAVLVAVESVKWVEYRRANHPTARDNLDDLVSPAMARLQLAEGSHEVVDTTHCSL